MLPQQPTRDGPAANAETAHTTGKVGRTLGQQRAAARRHVKALGFNPRYRLARGPGHEPGSSRSSHVRQPDRVI